MKKLNDDYLKLFNIGEAKNKMFKTTLLDYEDYMKAARRGGTTGKMREQERDNDEAFKNLSETQKKKIKEEERDEDIRFLLVQ
jgi:hypothetical protein